MIAQTLPAGALVLVVGSGASYKHAAARRQVRTARPIKLAAADQVDTWYVGEAAYRVYRFNASDVAFVLVPVALHAFEVPAGVEVRAAGPAVPSTVPYVRHVTSRVNRFTAADLLEADPQGWFIFRLQPNRAGYTTIRVLPRDVQAA
jgi:hypothetical protein